MNDATTRDAPEAKLTTFLTFGVDEQVYALGIEHVIEIVGMQSITRVPDVAEHVRGVINLRGKIVPVLDVRTRFELEEAPYHERTCIVVVELEEDTVGLVVDAVSEVVDIPDGQIDPAPELAHGRAASFVRAMAKHGDEVKLVLDVQALLYDLGEDLANAAAENGSQR